MISAEEFKKLDLRIGQILDVELVEGSEKLYKLTVDFGKDNKRTIVAGLRKYYTQEELKGRKFLFIVNIEHRKIMGIESEGMILAAEDEKGNLSLLVPEKEVDVGAKVG